MENENYKIITESFLSYYEGLDDPQYLADERDYKLAASKKAFEILGHDKFQEHLQNEDNDTIIKSLSRICSLTNLVNWRDFNFLKTMPQELQGEFCKKIYYLLFNGELSLEERIDDVAVFLESLEEAKNSNIWNFVTYLLFLYYPQEHYYVKPSVWREVCNKLNLKNPKTRQLRGESYLNILSICKDIMKGLKGTVLEPRDFIDLQSILFIASIADEGENRIKNTAEGVWGKSMKNVEYIIDEIFKNKYTHNVILEGPPGTGKTYTAHKTMALGLGENWPEMQFHAANDYSNGAWEIVQFHPNYSFEDFVRGLVAEPYEQGVVFTARDKIFSKMCQAALDYPKSRFYLIIDEINRGDLSKVLGELIYALEYRGKPVSLLYETKTKENGYASTHLVVPDNLFIIGTMNTADRSIALVDYAIRRRFSYFKMKPDRTVIEKYPYFDKEEVREKALKSFDRVQEIFEDEADDFRIGHTYFLVGTEDRPGTLEALKFKYDYQVVPLLIEYGKEGILEMEVVKGLIEND